MTASRNFTNRRYTPEDDALIAERYPRGDVYELALLLGRTHHQLECRASKLGIRRAPELISKARSETGKLGVRARGLQLSESQSITERAIRLMPPVQRAMAGWGAST